MRWPSSTPAGMRTLTWRLAVLHARCRAGRAGRRRHVPRPLHCGADLAEGEQPLVVLRAPRAAAARAGRGSGARGRPRARGRCGTARRWSRLTVVVTPLHGVVEGEVQLGLEVGAPLGARRRRRRAGRAAERARRTGRPGRRGPPPGRSPPPGPPKPPPPPPKPPAMGPRRADLVVLLALVGVAEDVVGRRDLLEALLVTRVGVRVVLLGQLAVGAGDLLGRGRLGHAQDLVVVLLEPFALGRHRVDVSTVASVVRRAHPHHDHGRPHDRARASGSRPA